MCTDSDSQDRPAQNFEGEKSGSSCSWRGYLLPEGATTVEANALAAIVREVEFSDLLVEQAVVLILRWANERVRQQQP